MNKAINLSSIFLLLALITACSEEEKGAENAIGTVIGHYSTTGWFELLVQVDEKYPIGKAIEYDDGIHCLEMPTSGTYRNMIRVQGYMPALEMTDKRMFFSYRKYRPDKDNSLFIIGRGIEHALCAPPDVPIYVITDCQIIE